MATPDFGVKYNFHQESAGSWLPALDRDTLRRISDRESREKQLGSGLVDYNLYGVAQKTLPKDTKLRANAGVLFAGNNSTGLVGITSSRGKVYTAGASLIKDFSPKLSLGAEATGAWTSDVD